jgi:hypothetical protein
MSIIGLIAATTTSVNRWREATGIVSDSDARWLRTTDDCMGLMFSAVICLPGWEARSENFSIHSVALAHIEREPRRRAADRAEEVEADIAQIDDAMNLADAMQPVRPMANAPAPPADSDDGVILGFGVSRTFLGVLTNSQRSAMAYDIRRGRNDRVRQYISTLARGYGVDAPFDERAGVTEDVHRASLIAVIEEGIGRVGWLDRLSTSRLSTLRNALAEETFARRMSRGPEEMAFLRERVAETLEAARREVNASVEVDRPVQHNPPPRRRSERNLADDDRILRDVMRAEARADRRR